MGVVSAILRFCDVHLVSEEWMSGWLANSLSQVASLVAYCCLIGYFVFATKVKK